MSMTALNIALYIEIMTLAFPQHFLFLASSANAAKNICFLTAAASRASINNKFAKRNNIGDIVGKATSQFTTTSLIGMALGSALSQVINISSIPQLMPTFLVLSTINLYCNGMSSRLVDENSFNNQRANLFFKEFLETGEIPEMKEINKKEYIFLPNLLNNEVCKYIRFGEHSISQVLTTGQPNYFATSMLHQLAKDERQFAYHITLLPRWKRPFRYLLNNNRHYVIHLNMRKGATSEDQLYAYYFARLLDLSLQKMYADTDSRVSYHTVEKAIREAEWQFAEVNMDEWLQRLIEKEWKPTLVYLDKKRNRYTSTLEHVEEVQ